MKKSLLTLANQLTISRLILAVIFFILLTVGGSVASFVAFGVFLLAGITDLLDGYIARKMQTVSAFGRVADALVDKIIICGGFVFLIPKGVGVQAWMVAVILCREFLVSAMRSTLESRGVPFGATWPGKLKALSQNIVILLATFGLGMAGTVQLKDYSLKWWWLNTGLMYLAVLLTVYSGLRYAIKTWGLFKNTSER